jgi:hypothetical protein
MPEYGRPNPKKMLIFRTFFSPAPRIVSGGAECRGSGDAARVPTGSSWRSEAGLTALLKSSKTS